MSPSRRVLDELLALMASSHRRGEPFERAWRRNVHVALGVVSPDQAAEWEAALRATRPAWRAAYVREATPHTDAIRALVAER